MVGLDSAERMLRSLLQRQGGGLGELERRVRLQSRPSVPGADFF